MRLMTPLRVLAYNLCFGGADRVDAIHAVLAQVNADVVALTEADDQQVVATLAERLAMHHIWARGSGDRHIATLSRFPVTDWQVYNTPPLTQAVLETKIEMPHPPAPSPDDCGSVVRRGGDALPSFGARSPTAPRGDRRSPTGQLSRETLRSGKGSGRRPAPNPTALGEGGREGEAITIYNVHFLPYLLLPFEIRRWQAVGKLLAVIRARRPGPHLILGDLNAIAPGDRVLQRNHPPRMRRVMRLQLNLIFRLAIPRLIKAGYVDCYRRLHPNEDGFTWMPGNRTTRYDYILADAALAPALRACQVVDGIEAANVASDHFPLLAEFELESHNK